MKNLILFIFIFQFILSGCSPDSGFHSRPSYSNKVTPTDESIDEDNERTFYPSPSDDNPNPTPHNMGPLALKDLKLVRREDQSFLVTAELQFKDKGKKILWSKHVELEGELDDNNSIDLWPVNGDSGDGYPVRGTITCMDKVTCLESIVDVLVNFNGKRYAAQVYVEMERNEPQPEDSFEYPQRPITPTPKKRPQRPVTPTPKRLPQRPITPTPVTAKAGTKLVHPSQAKPQSEQQEKSSPNFLQRLFGIGKKKSETPKDGSPEAMSQGLEQPQSPETEDRSPIIPGKDTAPAIAKQASKLPQSEDTQKERPGFFKRIGNWWRGPEKTNKESRESAQPPPKPQAPQREVRVKKFSNKKDEKSSSPVVMSKSPVAISEPNIEDSPSAKSIQIENRFKRPPQRPPHLSESSVDSNVSAQTKESGKPLISARPPAKPKVISTQETPVKNEASDEGQNDNLDHGDDLEEGDEEQEQEHDQGTPSVYIGTLYKSSDRLFATDRPPKKTAPSLSTPDKKGDDKDIETDVKSTNSGKRPRDQVIGKTSCWEKKDKGRSSCGSLDDPSDLTSVKNKKFAHYNQSRKRYFGSFELITIIKYLSEYFEKHDAFGKMHVNDLSQKSGGHLKNSDHKSHQNGLDADISFPVGKDGKPFTSYVANRSTTSSFKARETWAIFKAAWGTKTVDRIFINPALKVSLCKYAKSIGEATNYKDLLRSIRPTAGHHSHFHLRIKCTPDQPRCRTMGPPPAGSGC